MGNIKALHPQNKKLAKEAHAHTHALEQRHPNRQKTAVQQTDQGSDQTVNPSVNSYRDASSSLKERKACCLAPPSNEKARRGGGEGKGNDQMTP